MTLAVIPTTVHDSLPPGHVAPFPTCVLHRREAWCTLSSASLSLVTHVSFLFLPLPRSSAVRVSLSRPRCFLLSPPVIVFSAPVCCRFPSLAIHPHLPPHHLAPSAFLFRSAHPHHSAPYLCQRRRCHRYSDARTRTATRIFSAWECVRIGRANARSHPHEGELLRTMRYVHARARAPDSSLVRAPFLCGATGIT